MLNASVALYVSTAQTLNTPVPPVPAAVRCDETTVMNCYQRRHAVMKYMVREADDDFVNVIYQLVQARSKRVPVVLHQGRETIVVSDPKSPGGPAPTTD